MNGLSFIRRRCNLSQGQLAEKLGVTRQAKRHKAMFSAASQFSIPIFLDELELYEEHIVYNDAQFLRFLYKGIIINHNKKLSQPTLKRRFFKKKAAFFSWPGLGKEWC